jgi:hypothetical protein
MLSQLLKGQLAATVDEAIPHLQAAVAAQDAFHYDEAGADSRGPCARRWAQVLLDAGRAPEAERVFRADLAKNARSGRSLFGLMSSLDCAEAGCRDRRS